jgi:hypothetical protein
MKMMMLDEAKKVFDCLLITLICMLMTLIPLVWSALLIYSIASMQDEINHRQNTTLNLEILTRTGENDFVE